MTLAFHCVSFCNKVGYIGALSFILGVFTFLASGSSLFVFPSWCFVVTAYFGCMPSLVHAWACVSSLREGTLNCVCCSDVWISMRSETHDVFSYHACSTTHFRTTGSRFLAADSWRTSTHGKYLYPRYCPGILPDTAAGGVPGVLTRRTAGANQITRCLFDNTRVSSCFCFNMFLFERR